MNARQPFSWRMTYTLPSPCTAFSQSLSVNLFRIRGERAGNALTFLHGPRGPQRFGREEKWGLGTRLLPQPLCGCPFDFCVCVWGGGGIFFPKPLELEIFSLTYNSVRFFFQHCIRHEGNFFQCRILFFPGISLQALPPQNQSTGDFWFWKHP